ncbi:hypothetical protein [Actimicrobium sp. CCI2.3]|uniref:hypothetical protein n=1 Tax=Actimicrobium sp. CCI2.3 TaxID=3048616 RepID=UPI002AB53070|nr:hypothetical protein [Actimicrobium sp. CCI2.3]MDY7573648.1 hypothetical protein [Actimicrobium sp. CCI2.3]MEB0021081.1 hypothetical protein [Actimicrobium sp. CCI2.3]
MDQKEKTECDGRVVECMNIPWKTVIDALTAAGQTAATGAMRSGLVHDIDFSFPWEMPQCSPAKLNGKGILTALSLPGMEITLIVTSQNQQELSINNQL